jgi:PBSX family phage terminase large subunit
VIHPNPVGSSASESRTTGTVLAGHDRLRALPRPVLEAIRAELGPTFVNPQQATFYDSQAPEVLYSGAFRAGKSRIGCEKAYSLAKRYPGIPIGIFRKTAASLAASTERTLLHDVIPRDEIVRSNRTERWYELANGSRIWLFGLDPDPITGLPSKVGSVELGWAFIDEAAECSESDWIMVKGRLSWPGIEWHQIAAATNPASPKHWLKQRFTPPSEERQYLHASTLDNPALPADYLAEAMSMGDGYFRSRYIEGQWVAAEGQIWMLPDAQVAPVYPETIWHRTVAGLDWGYQHAFAVEVLGESSAGRKSVVAELYSRGRTLPSLLPDLLALQAKHQIETFYADPSEPAYIDECRAAGLRVAPATNDVLPGITAVAEEIRRGLIVDPACTGLLSEVPGYIWQTDKASGQPRDVPVKIGDDACDALRYAVMGLRGAISGQFSMVA